MLNFLLSYEIKSLNVTHGFSRVARPTDFLICRWNWFCGVPVMRAFHGPNERIEHPRNSLDFKNNG